MKRNHAGLTLNVTSAYQDSALVYMRLQLIHGLAISHGVECSNEM